MNKKKNAIVLCGGGAKGAYQIGALKALKRLNFKPDIVTGTSVGALNGCFAVMNNIKLGLKIWSNIDMKDIFSFEKNKYDITNCKSMKELIKGLIKTGSSASYEPLLKLIDQNVDENKIRNSKIDFGFVTTQFKPLKKIEIFKEDIPIGDLSKYVMASAACYPYMKSYSLNNKVYIDGGYFDNMPIEMALKKGATNIVVIDLKGIGKIKKQLDIPAKVTYIETKHDLGSLMIFDKNISKKNIRLGYLDTLKAFNKLEGDSYTFKKGQNIVAMKLENKMTNTYKKIFSLLPTATIFESVAEKSIRNCLIDYNEELFNINSNVLTSLQLLANIFKIDYLKIYTFDSLTKRVIKELNLYKKDNYYDDILNIRKILKKIIKIENVKNISKLYDKRKIVLYVQNLLEKKYLSSNDKKEIWILSIAFPDAILGSIFLESYVAN